MLFTFFAFLYFFFCAQASLREVPAAEKKQNAAAAPDAIKVITKA